MFPVFKSPILDHQRVSHGFFSKYHEISHVYDYFDTNHIITVDQVHGSDVFVVTDLNHVHQHPQADAIVTNINNIPISIRTADCGPLLLFHEDPVVIGCAHVGWRGAFLNIIDDTIHAMESLGAKRHHIRCVLGPCISKTYYEVGNDFKAPDDFLHTKNGKIFFDLPSFIQKKCDGLIFDFINLDTFVHPDIFHSRRFEKITGLNQLSVIKISKT
jgi:YfiH family protein